MSGDLIQKLLKSDGVSTLEMETKILEMILAEKWQARISTFYVDRKTKKARETDIYCRKTFSLEKHKKFIQVPMLHVDLFVEVKTMLGWSIVFGPKNPGVIGLFDRKLSYRYFSNSALLETSKKFLDTMSVSSILHREKINNVLFERAFPGGKSLSSHSISYPPVDIISSSFREITPEKTKDETNSVAWHAFLSLQSAIDSRAHTERKKIF